MIGQFAELYVALAQVFLDFFRIDYYNGEHQKNSRKHDQEAAMFTRYQDLDISFTIGNVNFRALNFSYEQFHRTIPSHAHGNGNYEIHYIPEGYGHALIDGRYYEITPGTLYVTGPHIDHAQSPYPKHPMCEYCIYLKTSSNRSVMKKSSGEDNHLTKIFTETAFWFGQDSQMIGEIIKTLFAELEDRNTGWEFQSEALLRQLFVKLVRDYEKTISSKASVQPCSTDKTSVIIEEYFLYQYRSLSLEELGNLLGLSTRQTQRLLQKQYGKTFLQKKTEARMSAAAILLSNAEYSITSIAEELGYSSIEHFSSAFRNYYFMSPRQYRKELKEQAFSRAASKSSNISHA